jgi:hypothetical protein
MNDVGVDVYYDELACEAVLNETERTDLAR